MRGTPLSPILYAKILGQGGNVPADVLRYSPMDLSPEEQAVARANIGATDTTTGLADNIKQALMDCFDHVAWADEHGQEYVDALTAALYPLSSISAVYTQSGPVYNTDSLDSLKADLVVTATYGDGTTQTVPAESYTLSGTLTAGTSTITVSYGGKTDTFVVSVVTPIYTLENASFNNERFVTGVFPFVNGDADLTILIDITFATMPTSGNGSKVRIIQMTNTSGEQIAVGFGKDIATDTAFCLWWMNNNNKTIIGKASVGRFRVALIHGIGSNSVRCKVHNADGTTDDKTATQTFVATPKQFGIGGAASGDYALPTGTVNAAYIYDKALPDSSVNEFLGLGGVQ